MLMDRAIAFIEQTLEKGETVLYDDLVSRATYPGLCRDRNTAKCTPNTAKMSKHYYGCITAIDDQVGTVVSYFGSVGAYPKTR